ncbi:HNH endonuclease [Pseudomonas sp. Q12-87]|uniref:HNH endonuclease n=1 Tax=Pseudomonas sp. Q12-87 TaxID=177989 RepID=UPI0009FAD499|nr:HNH endonuclease [Pseudomonas sp. Q12-87]
MNSLQRALIEKIGMDNGFEHTLIVEMGSVTLASARHPACATVVVVGSGFKIHFKSDSASLPPELLCSSPAEQQAGDGLRVADEAALAALLRRTAGLCCALPSQIAVGYDRAVAEALAALPCRTADTEIERFVRLRVGQQKFRQALLEYWRGSCAVTGVALPEVLRASHAKPWAECSSDAERLDVFNGFLLIANLDALFDRFLISFDDQGGLLISPQLPVIDLQQLGIHSGMRLRWLATEHQKYLGFHRSVYEAYSIAAR